MVRTLALLQCRFNEEKYSDLACFSARNRFAIHRHIGKIP
jgi:hypothetical protein